MREREEKACNSAPTSHNSTALLKRSIPSAVGKLQTVYLPSNFSTVHLKRALLPPLQIKEGSTASDFYAFAHKLS